MAALRQGKVEPRIRVYRPHGHGIANDNHCAQLGMLALGTGTDWATVTGGTTLKLVGNMTGLIAVSGVLAQHHVTAYRGQLCFNVAF